MRDELMRTMLTNSGMLPAAALVLMVVARVWTTLFEVVPAIAFLAVRRWNRREGPPNPA